MYKIVLTKRALKDLKLISPDVTIVLANKLKDFSSDPLKYAKKLTNPKIGTYRYRIGLYRVIYDLTNKSIVILRIGHRNEIYQKK